MSRVRHILLGTPARRRMTLAGIALLFVAGAFELSCQAYAAVVRRGFAQVMSRPEFYYQRSDRAALAYGLRRNYEREHEQRRVRINSFGFREDSESRFDDHLRVVVLGDSVVFATGLSQEHTISAALQVLLDPGAEAIKVLNAGVPGYALAEMPERLRETLDAYRPHVVVYLLNFNDFALRGSIYEGADNGLYRMFDMPWLKSPWFVRKAVYRVKKGDVLPSIEWYEWMYRGTRERNLPRIAEMQQLCRDHGPQFAIALIPIGAGALGDARAASLAADIAAQLRSRHGVDVLDPTPAFVVAAADADDGVAGLIDSTDHFTALGCEVMARAIEPLVRVALSAAPGPTPRAETWPSGSAASSQTPLPRGSDPASP
ncbi:MAG: hypothetical protein KF699_03655 [Phycisphaeraceae bacterium]|nr:hypothetical protein [Phycisphaeraceae bacterium]MBX3405603.1 hypothetical protein [Phycisphaeraceae bacterium]